jgi:methylmalonyl-CoA mutase cobalamin-binding subunit
MRDSGSPEHGVSCDLDWYGRLAQEALRNLVVVRNQRRTEVKPDDLDHFMEMLCRPSADDPMTLLQGMLDRQLEPVAVAHAHVPAAARLLGQQWLDDEITFVDVTVRTERLHGIVRCVDAMVTPDEATRGPLFLVLLPEGEQHTLGVFVLGMQLRTAGFSAVVRVAPTASELSQMLSTARFELCLVSVGCVNGLRSAPGLVKMLRLVGPEGLKIVVGGSIPMDSDALLAATGADSVCRDVATIISEYGGTAAGEGLKARAISAYGYAENVP